MIDIEKKLLGKVPAILNNTNKLTLTSPAYSTY